MGKYFDLKREQMKEIIGTSGEQELMHFVTTLSSPKNRNLKLLKGTYAAFKHPANQHPRTPTNLTTRLDCKLI
jgi:hypothetical protein